MSAIRFRLPDGRVVEIASDLARYAGVLDFTLADGRIVLAVREPGQ